MSNLTPVLKDIANRYARLDKALRGDSFTLSDAINSYAWIARKDGNASVLGMGHVGSADITKSTKDYISFVITTLEEDRDGDVVVPMGRMGKNYARNPLWFFGHQEWEIPIGTSRAKDGSIAVWSRPTEVISHFYPDRADEDAMFVFGKVQRGILNATSISFVPLVAQRRENMHKAHRNESTPSGWQFDSWDHTETSIVGVPANAGAIRDAMDTEKRHISPRMHKALKPYAALSKKEQGICWTGWCPDGNCGVKKSMPKVTKGELEDIVYEDYNVKVGDRVRHSKTGEVGIVQKLGKGKYGEEAFVLHNGVSDWWPLDFLYKTNKSHSSVEKIPFRNLSGLKAGQKLIYNGEEVILWSVRSAAGGKGSDAWLEIKLPNGKVESVDFRDVQLKSLSNIAQKYITHNGSKWIVHAESGKVLGTHDTKADAERQLRAVEANKNKSVPKVTKGPYEEASRRNGIRAGNDFKQGSIAQGLIDRGDENILRQAAESRCPPITGTSKEAWIQGFLETVRKGISVPKVVKSVPPDFKEGREGGSLKPGSTTSVRTSDLVKKYLAKSPCGCKAKKSACGCKSANKMIQKSEFSEMTDGKLKKEIEKVRAALDKERDAAWSKHGSHVGASDLVRLEGPQSTLAKLSSRFNLLMHEAKTNRGLTITRSLSESSGTAGGYTVPPCQCGGKAECPDCGKEKGMISDLFALGPYKGIKVGDKVSTPKGDGVVTWVKTSGVLQFGMPEFKVKLANGTEQGFSSGEVTRKSAKGTVVKLGDADFACEECAFKAGDRLQALEHIKATGHDVLDAKGYLVKSNKDTNMATKKSKPAKRIVSKKKPVRKAEIDEEVEIEKDDIEDVMPDEVEMDMEEVVEDVPFLPKASAMTIAKTFQHAKAEVDFLEEELEKMDHPGISDSLAKYKAKYVDPRMEHLKDMLHSHHGTEGEDADTLMDKCMKGMSTDGTGGSETDPGEAGMVQAGEIPDEDEVFKGGRRKSGTGFSGSSMAIAQRLVNAEERFIEYAMNTASLSRSEAEKVLVRYKKDKLIKLDAGTGQFNFTNGVFGDKDVLLRAAGKIKSLRKDFTDEEIIEDETKSVAESEGEYWVEYDDGTRRGPFMSHEEASAVSEGGENKDLDLVEWAEQEEAEPEHGGAAEEEFVEEVAEDVEGEIAGISPDEDTEEILERYQHPKSKKWLTRKVGTLKRVNGKTFIVKKDFLDILFLLGKIDTTWYLALSAALGASGAIIRNLPNITNLIKQLFESGKTPKQAARTLEELANNLNVGDISHKLPKMPKELKSLTKDAEGEELVEEETKDAEEEITDLQVKDGDMDDMEEKDAEGEELVEEETKDNDDDVDPEVLRRFKRLTKNLELNGFLSN